MKENLKKAMSLVLALFMAFTLLMPKMEVKAANPEEVMPYSVTVPVNAPQTVKPVSGDDNLYVVITMSGTMVRGADKNVTSYSLTMSRTIYNNSSDWEITSATITSKSFSKSGTGVVGNYTIEIVLNSLTNGATRTVTKSGTITCGV